MKELEARFRADLTESRAARRAGDVDTAWRLLEEAHVLSQPFAWLHVRSHLAMLALGARTLDGREVVGQVIRVAAAGPASLSGRIPTGNTGRSRVPLRAEMPIDPAMRTLLADARG